MAPEFTAYYISGVWRDHAGQVSHYAVHKFLDPGIGGCRKYSKEDVIKVVEAGIKPFYVMGWHYPSGKFIRGERVIIHNAYNGKMLWTEKMENHKKNLKHLIAIDWFEEPEPQFEQKQKGPQSKKAV